MTRLRLHVFVFTGIRTVLNTMHRMVYPFLLVFSRGLGVDLMDLALALSIRQIAGAFGPFLAVIADSRGRKTAMLSGLALFTIGVSLVIIWPTYPVFVLTLILSIVGKYLYDPSMQAYLADRVPYQRRGLVLAVTELSWSLAAIAGVPLVGFLIARYGWRGPFPLLALAGLFAIGLLAWLLPNDNHTSSERLGPWQNLNLVLHHAPALSGLAMGCMMSAANETVNLVFGVWMEDAFGLKIAALGAAAAMIGLAELGGEALVGSLTDRLGKPRAVGLGLLLNSMTAVALPILGHNLPGALVGLFLFYLTFEFTIVSAIPLMSEVLPSARATLMATCFAAHSLGRGLGILVAPHLYAMGIFASAGAAVVFNLLAWLALKKVKI